MKKRIIFIILIFSLLCLTGCKPETELAQFDVTMYCVQIDSDGEILRNLTLSISAEETEPNHYDANIVFSGTDHVPFLTQTINGYDLNPDRYDFYGIAYSAAVNHFVGVELTIDRDRTMFQMFVGDDDEEIYVGSTDPDFDPAAVLEYFSVVHQ